MKGDIVLLIWITEQEKDLRYIGGMNIENENWLSTNKIVQEDAEIKYKCPSIGGPLRGE